MINNNNNNHNNDDDNINNNMFQDTDIKMISLYTMCCIARTILSSINT